MTNSRLPPIAVALLIAIGSVVLQALLILVFAGPNARLAPHHLPIVLVGSPPATAALAAKLDAAVPGGFEIRQLTDEATADTALRHREAYAAVVVGPSGLRLDVAGAASQSTVDLLVQSFTQISGGSRIPIVDVVPPPSGDPHGTAYTLSFLPLGLTSAGAGSLLVVRVRSRAARLAGLLCFGVLGGLVTALVIRDWLKLIAGHYLPAALVLGLVALAVSAAVTGLDTVTSRAGVSLGAIIVVLVGNALSGISSAPQLLPRPWGTIGQFLPPGAGGTLLRSVSSFHWYGGTMAAWVLVGWVVAGLALVAAHRSSTVD